VCGFVSSFTHTDSLKWNFLSLPWVDGIHLAGLGALQPTLLQLCNLRIILQLLAMFATKCPHYPAFYQPHGTQNAIGFLTEQTMQHRNVCIKSVFVDKAGEWKLGGLECVPVLNVYQS
jgi:hypothetical protein